MDSPSVLIAMWLWAPGPPSASIRVRDMSWIWSLCWRRATRSRSIWENLIFEDAGVEYVLEGDELDERAGDVPDGRPYDAPPCRAGR